MSRPIPRLHLPRLPILASASVFLAAIVLPLASCGGSATETLTHIQGSTATITKAMLNHWMGVTVASDFRANVGTKAPAGLVSEPADYPRCVRAAKTVIPHSYTGKLKLSDAEISRKCHQLYQTIKAQALAYLLSVQWAVQEGQEAGIRVSDAEVRREFKRFGKEFYKSKAGERTYLAERHMVAADAMYQLKRNILVTRLRPKFEAEVKKAGGGERTLARLALANYQSLIAKTTCKAGYVVLGCKGYREPAVALPSASVILEGFAGAVG